MTDDIWNLPADEGAALLDDVEAFLARFVVYPTDAARIAHALWIAHTWFMDAWDSTPRIAFLSPEPGSGKSRALEVTEPLVPRALHAVNTTPAALFRKVSDEAGPPTILYDEIDTVFGPKAKDNEDVRGMLNAGHRKGATSLPMRGQGAQGRDRGAARLLRGRSRRSRRPPRHHHDPLSDRQDASACARGAGRAVADADQRPAGGGAWRQAPRLGR